jgi:HAD superfamily hydrolase (TIGR01509 family)
MAHINAILFDFGNVLAHIDFGSFWRELGYSRPEEIAPYTDAYKTITRQYEHGYISTEIYLNELRSMFNNKFTNSELERAFACIIQKPVEGIEELVRQLYNNYLTALVSNTNEIHHKIIEQLEVVKFLKKQYLSYRLHYMKPDRGFYDAIINDMGIYPSKMIFVDDLQENIKGAAIAGMNGIKFDGIENLEMMLKNLGVN